MSKSLFTATMLLAGIVFLHSYAKTDNGTTATGNPNPTEMLRQLPDSVFTDVKMEDLLRDEVYMKLAGFREKERRLCCLCQAVASSLRTSSRRRLAVSIHRHYLR